MNKFVKHIFISACIVFITACTKVDIAKTEDSNLVDDYYSKVALTMTGFTCAYLGKYSSNFDSPVYWRDNLDAANKLTKIISKQYKDSSLPIQKLKEAIRGDIQEMAQTGSTSMPEDEALSFSQTLLGMIKGNIRIIKNSKKEEINEKNISIRIKSLGTAIDTHTQSCTAALISSRAYSDG